MNRLSQSMSINPCWLQAVSRSWSPQFIHAPLTSLQSEHHMRLLTDLVENWTGAFPRDAQQVFAVSRLPRLRIGHYIRARVKPWCAIRSAEGDFLFCWWKENVRKQSRVGCVAVTPETLLLSSQNTPNVKGQRGSNLRCSGRQVRTIPSTERVTLTKHSRSGCLSCTLRATTADFWWGQRTQLTVAPPLSREPLPSSLPPGSSHTMAKKAWMTCGAANARGSWGDWSQLEPPIGGRLSWKDRKSLLTLGGADLAVY